MVIEKLKSLLIDSLENKGAVPDFLVEYQEISAHGDYSSNIAMKLAPILKQAPKTIAENLISKLKQNPDSKIFSKIEFSNPGFINFWLSDEFLIENLKKILKENKKYGSSNFGKKEKIQVEYISGNPTGPLTLGNGRGGFYGHALSNVLDFSGFKVEREYYVNDAGNQILTLGKSVLASLEVIPKEETFYKGEYIDEIAKKFSSKIKKLSKEPYKVGKLASDYLLSEIKKVVKKYSGISFDKWTSEDKEIRKKKYPEKAIEIFKSKNLAYNSEGALWLKTTEFGDDKDRVLVTKDGFLTYFASDAGHYIRTLERGFKRKILVLGPDHHGYVKRIEAAAKLVGMENPEFIVTQTIRLIKDGEELKMSKRKGVYIEFMDLIDEVGPDAARIFFLSHGSESHIDFDLNLAKEKSNKNPVFYMQYAFVRGNQILKKSRILKNKIPEKFSSEIQKNLIKEFIKFPDLILESAKDYRVNRLVKYALELSKNFHNFYEHERIYGEPNKILASERLSLLKAFNTILGTVFSLLGVSKIEKM